MLAEVETGTDILRITDVKQVVMTIFFTDEFGLVEKRKQVAAGFNVGTEIEETACLSYALRVVCQGVACAKDEVVSVLVFLALVGLVVKELLENRVDVVDFDAVQIDGRQSVAHTIVVFPVVTERCGTDVA